jgi:hypothetical protein
MIQTGNRNGFTCYRQADKVLRHRMDLISRVIIIIWIRLFQLDRSNQAFIALSRK